MTDEHPNCCWCGKKVARQRAKHWDATMREAVILDHFVYGSQKERAFRAFFCSLRCGYLWAVEQLEGRERK